VTHWQTPTHEPENSSFILTPGVDTKNSVTLLKRGPFKISEVYGGGFHDCREFPLGLQSDLCASCHQPITTTATSRSRRPISNRSMALLPRRRSMCQDCHLVNLEIFKRLADTFQKPARHEYITILTARPIFSITRRRMQQRRLVIKSWPQISRKNMNWLLRALNQQRTWRFSPFTATAGSPRSSSESRTSAPATTCPRRSPMSAICGWKSPCGMKRKCPLE